MKMRKWVVHIDRNLYLELLLINYVSTLSIFNFSILSIGIERRRSEIAEADE